LFEPQKCNETSIVELPAFVLKRPLEGASFGHLEKRVRSLRSVAQQTENKSCDADSC